MINEQLIPASPKFHTNCVTFRQERLLSGGGREQREGISTENESLHLCSVKHSDSLFLFVLGGWMTISSFQALKLLMNPEAHPFEHSTQVLLIHFQ